MKKKYIITLERQPAKKSLVPPGVICLIICFYVCPLCLKVVGVSEAYEDAANCLWLLTNSKPCANCKSPIQKNEGCNHMQCAKVRC